MIKTRSGPARLLCLALFVFTAWSSVCAQPSPRSEIRVEQDLPVGSPTDYALLEPHLSVDPRNPKHLVAAAMTQVSTGNQDTGCVAFSSFDGGASWLSTRVNVLCGDPWTAILPDGTALFSYLTTRGTIVVQRSPDGGRTWAEPSTQLTGAHDHPMLLVDAPRNLVYLVSALSIRNARKQYRSALLIAQSRDGGRSFSELARPVISNLSYEALTPSLFSDGTLAIGAIDHHDASDRRLERRRMWLVLLPASGAPSSEPMLVTESCSRTRFTAWPSLVVVGKPASSDERLLFTCEAQDNLGILFGRSDDHGDRWTAAARIDGLGDSVWTKTPTMTTNADGTLAVTWLDRREDPGGQCLHLYGMISLDRGDSFSSPKRLSSAPSCPTAARTGEGVLGRFPTGGEYHGLVSIGPRQFLAVWPDARDGRFQLRSVRFSLAER